MLICYDEKWPESARELTLRGADVLVMPTAWFGDSGCEDPETDVRIQQYRIYDQARAAENCRWFASSNYAGDLGGAQFFGLSQIVNPRGQVVAITGMFGPELAMADVDIRAGIAEANSFMGAGLIRDRRPGTT
jgi:predicted amidohydrolase